MVETGLGVPFEHLAENFDEFWIGQVEPWDFGEFSRKIFGDDWRGGPSGLAKFKKVSLDAANRENSRLDLASRGRAVSQNVEFRPAASQCASTRRPGCEEEGVGGVGAEGEEVAKFGLAFFMSAQKFRQGRHEEYLSQGLGDLLGRVDSNPTQRKARRIGTFLGKEFGELRGRFGLRGMRGLG